MGGGFFSKPETQSSSTKKSLVTQTKEENDVARRSYLMREAVCMRLHQFTNKQLYEGCALLGVKSGKSWSKARYLRFLYLEFQIQIPHDYGVKYMDYPIENATVMGKKQTLNYFREEVARANVSFVSKNMESKDSRKRVWEDAACPSKKHHGEGRAHDNVLVIEDVN